MAYCLACGNNRETHNGLCADCARAADMARRTHSTIGGRSVAITPEWVEANAARYSTAMARAFERAVRDFASCEHRPTNSAISGGR